MFSVHHKTHKKHLTEAWKAGIVHLAPATDAAIAYVAGYTAKKAGWRHQKNEERIDPETGEVYEWQPPFIHMSRNPGIAAHAAQWPHAWRKEANLNGSPVPVPRYLHRFWKDQASKEEILKLQNERIRELQQRLGEETYRERQQRLEAIEAIAIARQAQNTQKRKLH